MYYCIQKHIVAQAYNVLFNNCSIIAFIKPKKKYSSISLQDDKSQFYIFKFVQSSLAKEKSLHASEVLKIRTIKKHSIVILPYKGSK